MTDQTTRDLAREVVEALSELDKRFVADAELTKGTPLEWLLYDPRKELAQVLKPFVGNRAGYPRDNRFHRKGCGYKKLHED